MASGLVQPLLWGSPMRPTHRQTDTEDRWQEKAATSYAMQNLAHRCKTLSLKCMIVKDFNFKNPRWRTAAIWKIEKSWSHDDVVWICQAQWCSGKYFFVPNDKQGMTRGWQDDMPLMTVRCRNHGGSSSVCGWVQSAHLWWPAEAQLQAASVPTA